MSSVPFEERASSLHLVREFLLALEQPESANATRAAQQFVRSARCIPPTFAIALALSHARRLLVPTLQSERLLERVSSIKSELAATQGLDISAEEQRQLLAQLQIVAARKRFAWGWQCPLSNVKRKSSHRVWSVSQDAVLVVLVGTCREILAKFQVSAASDASRP
jgi:hypothetical protein